MIKSLLNTDLYKLTMMQAVFHQFHLANVKYEFKCRNKGINFQPHLNRIKQEIEKFRQLSFTSEDINYLQSLPYMRQDFLNYLLDYRNDRNRYEIFIDENNDLHINISGTWLGTILAEVPVLSIINEIFFTSNLALNDVNEIGRAHV